MNFLKPVGIWSRRQVLLVLFVGSLLIHLPGTWSLPLIDRDEPRFAEAAREMLQNGNYSIPYFNGLYRFDKPPLIYWCQVACYRLFGVNEFAARLPSVLSTALLAIAIAWMGERMFNRETGFWAGLIFTTCVQTVMHAKGSVADMLMVLFFFTAAWAVWEMSRMDKTDKRISSWALFFSISLALGFLAKGPVAWLPIGAVLTWAGVRKDRIHGEYVMVAILLALYIVAVWGVPALLETNGQFAQEGLGKHVYGRSVAAMEGHGAKGIPGYLAMLPFFFVIVFVTFLPWAIYLPKLLREAWHRRKQLEARELYLWLNILWVFGVFTLVSTKLPHYILPAFPFLALLCARRFAGSPLFIKMGVSTAALILVVGLAVCPLLENLFPSRALYKKTASQLQSNTAVAASDFGEPSLVWEFRKNIDGLIQFKDVDDLDAFMAEPGQRIAVLPTERMPRAFPNRDPKWKVEQIRGFNIVKFRRVDLSVVEKAE